MTFPTLTNWQPTANSLHQLTQVVAAVRSATVAPMDHYLQFSTTITPNGLSTGRLPFGGALLADFTRAAVVYEPADGPSRSVAAQGQSQADLADGVLAMLAEDGHAPKLDRSALSGTSPLTFDPQTSRAYAQVLWRIFTATARFRARIFAPMTPIVVWSEHFDLSFLTFTTEAHTSEEDPHINFGFAPFDTERTRPYLYSYAWPLPAGHPTPDLPAPAQWGSGSFQGIVVDYDDLTTYDDPEELLEETFMTISRVWLALMD